MKPKKPINIQRYISIKRAYFDEVFFPIFKHVRNNKSAIEKKYIIAGKNILLKFYTPSLVSFLTGALVHHADFGGAAPDHTIHIFDTITTGAAPAAPWKNTLHYYALESNTPPHEPNSFAGVYWHDETLNLYDPENHQSFFWAHDASTIPNWVAASPLRGILHWILSEHEIHLLHGAVIGDNNTSVLLSAKSGSGKSTTALACLLADMNYIADDYSAIELGNETIAHNLYNSVKVLPDGFNRFPELYNYKIWNQSAFENGIDVKAFIFMDNTSAHRMKISAPLSAILIPKITGKETQIVPATKMEAMLALIPSTLFQLPLPGTNKVAELKKIIDTLPCYTIELGPNVREVPRVIREFLKANSS